MLVEFTVGNFLSFKELSTISLVTSALKESHTNEEDIVFNVGEGALSLLKSAVIYGANGSGKSNFIKALEFFQWFMMNSSKLTQANEGVSLENFSLNSNSAKSPSYFEAIFIHDNSRYRYGFELDSREVHREWLFKRNLAKRSKEIEIFFRDGSEYQIHTMANVAKEIADKNMVRNNALLLSVAAQFNDQIAVNILEWLSQCTIISTLKDPQIMRNAISMLDNREFRERMVDFVKYADLGIEQIGKVDNQVISTHIQYDDEGAEVGNISFNFQKSESEGTIKYFSLAYPIINVLDRGGRLFIDEFDAKMHPMLTYNIVALFNSQRTNPHNAQLVFTTHDTNLLSPTIFRRDQIWFTQKDRFGASELYPLSDYKVRGNAAFEKDYLSGKYGAVPIIGDLANIFSNNK